MATYNTIQVILVVPVTATYEYANKQILKGKLESTSYGDIINSIQQCKTSNYRH